MGRRERERRARGPRAAKDRGDGGSRTLFAGGALVVLATVLMLIWHAARPSVAPDGIARDGSPAWSPDGRRIAFYSERDGNSDIYVMDARGGNVARLTESPADEGYPAWSPDGRTITFDSDRDGNFEIYAMDADGSNVRRLTSHPSRDVSASWSPDGAAIAFMSDRNGGFDVYVMKPDGTGVTRRTTTGTSWFPVFSPDGRHLAFHVGRDVHVAGVDAGSPLQRLTHDPANGMYPSWSPDGRRIAFMSWRSGRTELFVMNADGTGQRRVVSMPQGDAIDPRWSPDGTRLAFVHMPGGMQTEEKAIYTVNVDGTGLARLSR